MKRVLVIRFSALGDVAMLIAALRDAALAHPETDYTLLSKGFARQLLPALDNVHFLALGEKIDWKKYDMVVDAHSVWRSWGIDLQAIAHLKPVRRIRKGRLKKWLLTHGAKVEMPTMHVRYRRLLDAPLEPTITQGESERHNIGVAPFAAHKGKIYPLKRMERVVAQLGIIMKGRGEEVFLFGAGDTEKAILDNWAEKYEGVVSLVGKQKMAEEMAIMVGLRLMLTMDSGNLHLASLAGTRVVSIWGATHPKAGFLGVGQKEEDCIQREEECRPCSVYGNKPCKWGDWRCLDIEEEEIVRAVEERL